MEDVKKSEAPVSVDEDWKKEAANSKAEMEAKQQDNDIVWVNFEEVKGFLNHISGTLAALGANIMQTIELIEKQVNEDKEENKGEANGDD